MTNIILADIRFVGSAGGGNVASAALLDRELNPSFMAAVNRYVKILDSLVDMSGIDLVFSPSTASLWSAAGTSRTVYAKGIHEEVDAVSTKLDLEKPATAIFILERDFIEKIPSYDDARMREIVTSDIGAIVAGKVNLKGEGPVSGLLPWFVALAGSVIAHRVADGSGDVLDRAVTKVAHAFSMQVSKKSGNAFSKMNMSHPDFLPVLDVVGHKASEASSALPQTQLPFPVICETARRVVVDALRSVGVMVAVEKKLRVG